MLRIFRLALLAASLWLTDGASSEAATPELVKRTATYRKVGSLEIQADVYRPDDTVRRPVVVWIHGGALIMGRRNSVPLPISNLCRAEGFALVSFDYRLVPETRLPELITDLDEAFRWLRGAGAREFHLDPDRLVVTGGSAGGYLTLMTGVRLSPKPQGLVAYWGYGDVDGAWATQPSTHYRLQPLVSRDEAYSQVGDRVVTGSESNLKERGRFYLYLRQNGLWSNAITGLDPVRDRARLDTFCPVRNVTREFPPTLLIHGTADMDVPYALSADMVREFTRHHVPHELITIKGAGHGLSGADPKTIADVHERAATFIRKGLAAPIAKP